MDLDEYKRVDTSTSSEDLNRIYSELEALKAEHPTFNLKIEVLMNRVKNLCKRSLKKKIRGKQNITGSLEFKILKEDQKLRVLKSKWARRRGLSFEDEVKELLNRLIDQSSSKGVVYNNRISKFGTQPYDLIFFLPKMSPFLFECKASGIGHLKDQTVKLTPNLRRYQNHYDQLPKIERFLDQGGLSLYFVFLDEPNRSIYFVPHKKIVTNLPELFHRRVILEPKDYFSMSLDKDTISRDCLSGLVNFLVENQV